MSTQPGIFLASASPRRREIITKLALPFMVGVAPIDELAVQAGYQGPVEELGLWTAHHKALAALTLPEAAGKVVVTADTTVVLEGKELGKPCDAHHARELLRMLRGRRHQVITGVVVCARRDGEARVRGKACTTPVLMRNYSDEEIDSYIATGDPLDKAGAYGIQHPSFQPTERIEGCYLNVVGLPLCTLVDLLAQFDVYPATTGCRGTACPWSERCIR